MTIQSIINKVEDKHDVDILSVVELGSRAYNLHTSESDHDIYFVYKQPIEEYVMIDGYNENINEGEIIENWEVQGWNVKKFAELIYNSNPTALEFINSPVKHYYKNYRIEKIFEGMREYAVNNANPIGLYYHYISLSKRMYNKYIVEDWEVDEEAIHNSKLSENLQYQDSRPSIQEYDGDVELSFGRAGKYPIQEAYEKGWVRKTTTERTVKRNLFLIRGICCAKWVKHNKSIPPFEFNKLLDKQNFLSEDEEEKIRELVDKKLNNNNEFIGKFLPEFIEKELNTKINDKEYNTGKLNKDKVNSFIEITISN